MELLRFLHGLSHTFLVLVLQLPSALQHLVLDSLESFDLLGKVELAEFCILNLALELVQPQLYFAFKDSLIGLQSRDLVQNLMKDVSFVFFSVRIIKDGVVQILSFIIDC